AGVRASWSGASATTLWARAAWRRYGDADVAGVMRPLEDDGWRASAGASRRLSEAFEVDARYALDWGPGAFLSAGDAAARWTPLPDLQVSANLTTFQQIEE